MNSCETNRKHAEQHVNVSFGVCALPQNSPHPSDNSFGHEDVEHEYMPIVEQIELFPFFSGSDPKKCLSQSRILCHFGTGKQAETSLLETPFQDIRQQAANRLRQFMMKTTQVPYITSMSASTAEAAVAVNKPQYCIGTRCEHVEHWKRLRAKKGQIYYVCHLCGCKWRIPTRVTLETLMKRNRHNYA